MSRKGENWIGWLFATIGIAGAGFAAGLHRLVWGLFWVVTAIWWLVMWWSGSKSHNQDEFLRWLLALGPPLIVGFVLRIVEGVVFALLGGASNVTDISAPSDSEQSTVSKRLRKERTRRRALGYDE